DRLNDYLKILAEIRDAGIPAEIFSGDTKNLTKQIKYGDKVGIPFAVIVGSDEFDNNQVTVKNLEAGREKAKETSDREEWLKAEDIQITIKRDELIEYFKKHLDK
ncbi:MAG: His/Gly/Thr/Pro-type tRNA ligase C-terminal domain-containing protein, partial [candidate division Zixibacteria bacterium]|nr:His/Gly/Thr/Pro-type tRNA ligase C-terminal domain-containing protein [candidate division Zixibacteria bacterium]